MSFEQNLRTITLPAAADLSASQYLIVVTDSSGKAALSGVGASNTPTGVLQNKPTAGQASTVAVDGITKCIAGGVIAPGAKVASDSSGKAVTAQAGDYVLGIAQVTANTASGDIFPVLIDKLKI